MAARAPQSDGDLSKQRSADALDEKGFAEGDMVALSIEGQLVLQKPEAACWSCDQMPLLLYTFDGMKGNSLCNTVNRHLMPDDCGQDAPMLT